jgi:hypothetical protein
MSEMSDYLEDELIKHLFRTGSFTKPTVLAITLLTAATNDAGIGQFSTGSGTEVTNAGAYARVNRAPLDANWAATAGGNGVTSNVAAITFSQATASWGIVTDMAICDNATYDTGNMLFYSPVTTSRTIDSGDTAEFAIGAITVTLA